jgi:hypothetical protein
MRKIEGLIIYGSPILLFGLGDEPGRREGNNDRAELLT